MPKGERPACLPACLHARRAGRPRSLGEGKAPFVFSRVRVSHRSAAALGKAAFPLKTRGGPLCAPSGPPAPVAGDSTHERGAVSSFQLPGVSF